MNSKERVAFLEAHLSRNLNWIGAADAKTGFIFAISTAMLGMLAAAAPPYGKWPRSGVTLAMVASGLLLLSLAALIAAVFPRTAGPKLSLIFFGGVAGRSVDEFRSDVLGFDETGYIEDLIQQCHINAQIAGAKYTYVKRASICLYLAVLPWMAAAYILFRDRGAP